MLVIQDAWLEIVDMVPSVGTVDFHQAKYSLALGKDPLNDAQLLPVATVQHAIVDAGVGATDQPATGVAPAVQQLFNAHGTMWAAKAVAIDIQEVGGMNIDADVHMDWSVALVDWWTWFTSWNNLEASPDGSLIDGEREYA